MHQRACNVNADVFVLGCDIHNQAARDKQHQATEQLNDKYKVKANQDIFDITKILDGQK